jgi:hypothetical protein
MSRGARRARADRRCAELGAELPPAGLVDAASQVLAQTAVHSSERWRAHLTVDDEVAHYCPQCAVAEFEG